MKHAESALVKTTLAAAAGTFDFAGHWKNELKSYMDLTVQGSAVSGTYVSATSTGGGPTPPFPVIGTISGDLISWTVNWGTMITAWVGHGVVDDAGNAQILTMWQIIQTVADETNPQNQWKTVLAGADEFFR